MTQHDGVVSNSSVNDPILRGGVSGPQLIGDNTFIYSIISSHLVGRVLWPVEKWTQNTRVLAPPDASWFINIKLNRDPQNAAYLSFMKTRISNSFRKAMNMDKTNRNIAAVQDVSNCYVDPDF